MEAGATPAAQPGPAPPGGSGASRSSSKGANFQSEKGDTLQRDLTAEIRSEEQRLPFRVRRIWRKAVAAGNGWCSGVLGFRLRRSCFSFAIRRRSTLFRAAVQHVYRSLTRVAPTSPLSSVIAVRPDGFLYGRLNITRAPAGSITLFIRTRGGPGTANFLRSNLVRRVLTRSSPQWAFR